MTSRLRAGPAKVHVSRNVQSHLIDIVLRSLAAYEAIGELSETL